MTELASPEAWTDAALNAFYAMKNANPEHRENTRRALAAAVKALLEDTPVEPEEKQ